LDSRNSFNRPAGPRVNLINCDTRARLTPLAPRNIRLSKRRILLQLPCPPTRAQQHRAAPASHCVPSAPIWIDGVLARKKGLGL